MSPAGRVSTQPLLDSLICSFTSLKWCQKWTVNTSSSELSVVKATINNFRNGLWSIDVLHCLSSTEGLKTGWWIDRVRYFCLWARRWKASSYAVHYRGGGEGGGVDDGEPKTVNHGWCHPPQSLWPAPLWSHRCDSPKHIHRINDQSMPPFLLLWLISKSFMLWNLNNSRGNIFIFH